MHALSAPFTRTYEALKIIMRQEMEYKTKFTGGIYGIQTKVWRNTLVRTIPLRIFTTARARQQVTPPHLDVLFMATATIVVEANEAVSGPLSVQFLTKRKVSFFLPPPALLPFYASFLLPWRPLLFPSVRHRERKRGRDTKFEPGKWAQWRWKRRGSMLRSWSKHLR